MSAPQDPHTVVRGIAFPFRIDAATGGVAHSAGAQKIRENIMQLVLTDVGERVMRRDYGGGARQLVHDPNAAATAALLRHQLSKTITLHEPRVSLVDVSVATEDATLFITVLYTLRLSGEAARVTVPVRLG